MPHMTTNLHQKCLLPSPVMTIAPRSAVKRPSLNVLILPPTRAYSKPNTLLKILQSTAVLTLTTLMVYPVGWLWWGPVGHWPHHQDLQVITWIQLGKYHQFTI